MLVPKPVDCRVGTREVDLQFPGSTVRGVDRPELGGVLKLGGALRPPAPMPPPPPDIYKTWDDPMPRPLQEDLARLLNLPDDYKRAGDPDPMLAPPLYGRWHALADRVLTAADGLRLPGPIQLGPSPEPRSDDSASLPGSARESCRTSRSR